MRYRSGPDPSPVSAAVSRSVTGCDAASSRFLPGTFVPVLVQLVGEDLRSVLPPEAESFRLVHDGTLGSVRCSGAGPSRCDEMNPEHKQETGTEHQQQLPLRFRIKVPPTKLSSVCVFKKKNKNSN